MRKIFTKMMAVITRHDRQYKERLETVDNSIVFNVFRLYEYIFGRRSGIRKESETYIVNGIVVNKFYSIEASLIYIESIIRKVVKDSTLGFKFVPIPIIQFVDVPINLVYKKPIFVCAIAYDNFHDQVIGSPEFTKAVSFSFTTAGSDRGMLVGAQVQQASYYTTGFTYNGVSSTVVDTQKNGTNNEYVGLYYLTNPASGTNTCILQATSNSYMYPFTVSFSGVHQTSMLNTSAKNQANSVASISVSPTTTVDNCWAVSFVRNDTGTVTSSTNYTVRGASNSFRLGDSNGTVGTAGSKTITASGTTGKMAIVTAMIAPSASSPAVNSNFLQFM